MLFDFGERITASECETSGLLLLIVDFAIGIACDGTVSIRAEPEAAAIIEFLDGLHHRSDAVA